MGRNTSHTRKTFIFRLTIQFVTTYFIIYQWKVDRRQCNNATDCFDVLAFDRRK